MSQVPPVILESRQTRCIGRTRGERNEDDLHPYDPNCTCTPCRAHQLEERMSYVLDHLPINGKIHPSDVREFRGLVSENPELSFTDKLMEFDAFSASTAAEQRELVYKAAAGAMTMMEEEACDLGSQMLGLEDLIKRLKPLRAADARM